MSSLPAHDQPGHPQIAPPPQKKPPYRFRWNLLGIIIVIIGFLYLLNGAEPSFTFAECMDYIGIHDKNRFRLYFTLGCIGVATVAILRILQGSRHIR